MSKSNIDKQVYEQYVDATVALFMEHYAAALTDAVMQNETAAPVCPEALEQRCMTAIRKEYAKGRTRAFWKGTKKVLRSAAMVLVALLSLSSILFLTVEAFRVPVINFFIEQGDGFWAITGRGNDGPVEPIASTEFDPNDPLAGLLPEGYELVNMKEGENGESIAIYKNQNGNRVFFWIRTNTSHMTLNSENTSTSKKCKVAYYDGVFVLKDSMVQLAWVDEEANTSYMLNADTMDENQLLTIAEYFIEKILK